MRSGWRLYLSKTESYPTVRFTLVPETVRLPIASKLRLIERRSQRVQVRPLGEGQPDPHPCVDPHCLGEQLRPSIFRLDSTQAGLEQAGDAGRAFQRPVVVGVPPFDAVLSRHPLLDQGIAVHYPPVT